MQKKKKITAELLFVNNCNLALYPEAPPTGFLRSSSRNVLESRCGRCVSGQVKVSGVNLRFDIALLQPGASP